MNNKITFIIPFKQEENSNDAPDYFFNIEN